MAYTVEGAFDSFYDEINLSGDHREAANARKDHLIGLLKDAFDIRDAFSAGSIPKFTALKARADVDVILALNYGKHIKGKTPKQVLESVQDALSLHRTNVRKNGQAVTLHYKTWPSVDIVPVSRTLNNDGTVNYYEVPNANTGVWIKSRPRKLTAEIEEKATECGKNFRRIIKMVKHWNHIHSEYLSSYHIEVLALNVFSSNLDDTPWNVFKFFDRARPLLANSLWYELNYADAYLSPSDREEALKRFDTAIDKTRGAWYLTCDGKNGDEEAIALWRQVFGGKFPSYG